MKYMLLVLVCLMLCLTYGCHLKNGNDPVQEFIPGTYIRFSAHEFGKEYDTLVITLQNKNAGEYKITRRWNYERVLDGAAIEPEYKLTKTTVVFEPKHQLLREIETGSVYTFDVGTNLLFNGPIKYRKL